MTEYVVVLDMSSDLHMEVLRRSAESLGIDIASVKVISSEEAAHVFGHDKLMIETFIINDRYGESTAALLEFAHFANSSWVEWKNPFTKPSCSLRRHFVYGSTLMT